MVVPIPIRNACNIYWESMVCFMMISNRKTYLWILTFILAFSSYLFDASVAMAQPQRDAEPVKESSYEEEDYNTDKGQNTKPDAGADISQDAEQSSDSDTEPDTVATADEFKEWMDAHKNYGGRVKLTGNIILREFYYFTPNGANRPDIIVDTDGYMITASGKIAFISDGHLIFRGKNGGQSIFRVMKGGMLTLDGVIVESSTDMSAGQYVIWQEEGAGLVIADTYVENQISGDIHYADTPFVTQSDKVCVIVEKGQVVDGLLPTEIKGTVNFQGQIQSHQLVPVSWNLKGTERQQEKRLRFQVKGFSSEVTYDVAPVCTVVYNDYPLTFTNVDAYIYANAYYFQGGYTKPKEDLPIMVASEYSFDGINWVIDKEEMAATDNAGFSISFPCSQWDTAQYSYIYIRLRGEKENKRYYSNVLRYAAYNMEAAEDLGDSLGGDTSIVNPPENPEEDSTDKPSGDQKPSDNPKPSEDQKPSNDNKPSDDGKSLDKDSGKHEGDNSDTDTLGDSQSSNTDVLNDSAGFPDNIAATEPITDPAGEHDAGNTVLNTTPIENANSHTDNNKNQNTEGNRNPSVNETGADVVQTETETMDVMSKELAAAAQEGTDGDAGLHQPMTVKQKIDKTRNIVLILGLITLSAGVGVAAYFIHAGRTRRSRRRRTGSSQKSGRKRKQ